MAKHKQTRLQKVQNKSLCTLYININKQVKNIVMNKKKYSVVMLFILSFA